MDREMQLFGIGCKDPTVFGHEEIHRKIYVTDPSDKRLPYAHCTIMPADILDVKRLLGPALKRAIKPAQKHKSLRTV